MDMRLVVNTGSTSKKYTAFNPEAVFEALFEKRDNEVNVKLSFKDKETKEYKISFNEYGNALQIVLDSLEGSKIDAVGIRVVAPGIYFTKHRKINDDFLHKLRDAESYASLHIISALLEILQLKEVLPDTPLFGISDSVFHSSIGEDIKRYSINREDTDELELYRYGYHGLSVSSVLRVLADGRDNLPERIIVCHVGGGSSVSAIRNGKSVDTSMGFSPVGGVPMSSRSGDIDPGALLYLGEKKGMSYGELRQYLNTEGGFRGVTGGVSDMRDILRMQYEGDDNATLAFRMFITSIKKKIGAYVAVLGGLDAVILTGSANERNYYVRESILDSLECFGILIDKDKNEDDNVHLISKVGSSVEVHVIKTDEMGEIFRETTNLFV